MVSTHHLAQAARTTRNVVIVADVAGRATWVNPAFERVTGYRADEVLGRKPGDLLQFSGTSAQARAELSAAVREQRGCRVQILNRTKSGRAYWMDVDLQPMVDDDGRFEGFVSVQTDITEVMRQREQAQTLLNVLPAGVLLQSTDAKILSANPLAAQTLGMPAERLIGLDTRAMRWSTIDADGRPLSDGDRPLALVLEGGVALAQRRIGIRSQGGEQRWLDLRCVPLKGPAGEVEAALTCFVDVTDAVRIDAMLKTALRAADLGTWSWNPDADVWSVSPDWAERFGPAVSAGHWQQRVHPDDMRRANAAMAALLRGDEPTYQAEFRFCMADGQWRWLRAHAAVAERSLAGRVVRVSGVVMDIDEPRRAEEQLRIAATTDVLTGLPNRALLADRLGRALASCQRHGRRGALIYLDLDHFKRVNDTHGHAAGDALLREVTRRLERELRTEDTLARMGGDELMVLLPDLAGDEATVAQAAAQVADKLREALDIPVQVADTELRIGASFGITVFPRGDQPTVDDLIREADTAMYAAKQAERGSSRIYEATMREHLASRSALELALRKAIERNQVELHLQGQWSTSGALAGFEALARWHDPVHGQVPPSTFIPLAEETGLIVPLGRRVIEQACILAARLKIRGLTVPVAVNVSPTQFTDPAFAEHLTQTAAARGVAASDLTLELTEGMLANETSARLMNRLAQDGFRFSIDDFGTGWSNLVYLKRLPLHELKIDHAFVRDLIDGTGPAHDGSLVHAIIGIARRFGIETVAEGVETRAQADFLIAAGCDRLQGFLFDRPRPIGQVLTAMCSA